MHLGQDLFLDAGPSNVHHKVAGLGWVCWSWYFQTNHDDAMQFINNADHRNLGHRLCCVVGATKGSKVNNNDSEVGSPMFRSQIANKVMNGILLEPGM